MTLFNHIIPVLMHQDGESDDVQACGVHNWQAQQARYLLSWLMNQLNSFMAESVSGHKSVAWPLYLKVARIACQPG